MTECERVLNELKRTFGYETFKSDLQKRAVTAVSEGNYYIIICSFRERNLSDML